MDTITLITLISFIIFVGYLGDYAFIKFRFPDILVLILIGYLLTFFLNLNVDTILYAYLSIAATISLIIILFEGGLTLHVSMIRGVLRKASYSAVLYYSLSMVLITSILFFILKMNLSISFLYGSILSSPSVAIVIPLINRANVDEEVRHLYIVQVTLLDLISIIMTISILQYFPINLQTAVPITVSLLTNIFAQTFFGFIAGIFWIEMLRKIERVELSYMLTLGFLFAIYAFSDFIWKNGMITSMVFGIVMGNNTFFRQLLRMKDYSIDQNIFKFNKEVSFFMRTVIFVAIGSILIFKYFDPHSILIIVITLIVIYSVQVIQILITDRKLPNKFTNYIMPRGLTQVVLGILSITSMPSLNITFIQNISIVVILTNVISAILIFIKK